MNTIEKHHLARIIGQVKWSLFDLHLPSSTKDAIDKPTQIVQTGIAQIAHCTTLSLSLIRSERKGRHRSTEIEF